MLQRSTKKVVNLRDYFCDYFLIDFLPDPCNTEKGGRAECKVFFAILKICCWLPLFRDLNVSEMCWGICGMNER